ncbi:MAG TPA: winged helix DNA-binding domain-containing protein [Marmoricola sp.]|nr:winged helix DNA-binding domain-containing protein [Marmoricola sp.]
MTETLTPGDLNRTLLARQGLLRRSDGSALELVGRLVGLQAQATLPPYLGLAARLGDFDPRAVSAALDDRSLVRMYTLRGTVHLLAAADAAPLWRFARPVHAREVRQSQNLADVRHLGAPRTGFAEAVDEALVEGPLPVKELGERLATRWPDLPPRQLGGLARVVAPLVQLPPRGQWRASGGVVYQRVDTWTGTPAADPDVPTLVRRYLAAYGPATAADVTTWSGVPGMASVLRELLREGADWLVVHRTTEGKALYDVVGAPLVGADVAAPVRLLGTYDNLWLSHAGRDRVTTAEQRKRWMGVNGGSGCTVFVDGMLAGLWRVEDDRPVVTELFGRLTRAEHAELDDELERVRALLEVPAG